MKFIFYITIIFNPSYWLMNKRYCKAHDEALLSLMNLHQVKGYNGYHCFLGKTKIWVANFPYAIGIDELSKISRPSRYTIYKLGILLKKPRSIYHEQITEEYLKKYVNTSF